MRKLVLIVLLSISIGSFAQNNPADFYDLYHTMEESYALITDFAHSYPDIVFVDTIGFSQAMGYPIIALKISDNPDQEEDEPCVWYDGLHHAREPIGMEACLNLIDHLLSNYIVDEQITYWIDHTEIWVVPMINPEGWEYIVNNNLPAPHWRKNLRDNNGNGLFDPSIDGVDVNRNYDFNWILGGSGNWDSWTYRGSTAFSESEARAKRDQVLSQKPAISLSYHTWGEIVIYSWSEEPQAPDQELIIDIAQEIASRIPTANGSGTYRPTASNCQNGFSRCWMYTVAGCLEYTVECAREFIPPGETALQIAQDNLEAALYVLDRVHGAGISLHISDAINSDPLVAEVKIPEIFDPVLTPRTSDSLFGRLDRILLPGRYNIQISKEGYQTELLANIEVREGISNQIEVQLKPASVSSQDVLYAQNGSDLLVNKIYPNPFSTSFTIEYSLYQDTEVSISLVDLLGKQIEIDYRSNQAPGKYQWNYSQRNNQSLKLEAGVYFLVLETNHNRTTKRLIKTN